MITFKKIVIHTAIAVCATVILAGTLFISRPVEFPDRIIKLGYPIPFYTLDLGSPHTSMGGATDEYLTRRNFNILSSWEQYVQVSWRNFIGSYIIIFLIIEVVYLVVGYAKLKSDKK
jgi:hypothetical protein